MASEKKISQEEYESLLLQVEELKLSHKRLQEEQEKKNRENETLRLTLFEIEKKSVFQYFQDDKQLPELRQDGTSTGPTSNKKHHSVLEYNEYEFGLIAIEEKHLLKGKTKTTKIFEETTLSYSTEKDVESYCKIIIEDIIYTAELTNSLSLRGDLTIAELRADFWIISYNGFPIGAVEIKKPKVNLNDSLNQNDLTTKLVYGQLFDYLMRIRSFHGVKFVFGIFSDFREWRICWLPDSDSLALATNLVPIPDSTIDEKIAEKRVLHVSQPYCWKSAKSIALALYSVLLKMNAAVDHIEPVPLLSKSRPYIVLNESSWLWKSGIKTEELQFSMPRANTKNFFLLRDFHGGADGRVWLACHEKSGALVVIKFQCRIREGRSGTELEHVEQEVSYWRKIGFSKVYHTKLADRHAIIMPFGFHFKRSEDNNIEIDNNWWKGEVNASLPIKDFAPFYEKVCAFDRRTALESCVEKFSLNKLVHDDIEWRHVALFPLYTGFFQRELKLMPCFIDLSRVTETKFAEQAKKEMNEKMEKLMKEL